MLPAWLDSPTICTLVPLQAGNSVYKAQLGSSGVQHRTLFNMDFDKALDLAGVDAAVFDLIRVEAKPADGLIDALSPRAVLQGI